MASVEVVPKHLTENERKIALRVAAREGGETRKWLNLVLEAYDAVAETCEGNLEGLRDEMAYRFREWVYETPLSKCNMGADMCPDWDLAYELTDLALGRKES
jgi:hypothetical protein